MVKAVNGSQPLVTTIIPAYNQSQYITRTIESVCASTVKDIEIIVVDDESTDNTQEVLEPYKNKMQCLFKKNDGYKGPGGAINLGLKHAKGVFIHCLDSDDMVLPHFYERVLKEFNKNNDVGAVCSDAYYINENDEIVEEFRNRRFSDENILLDLLEYNSIISSTMVVKTECYGVLGKRKPEYEICDDYELWLRVAEKFRIGHVPECLLLYRNHEEGISKDTTKMFEIVARIRKELYKRHTVEDFFPILRRESNPYSYDYAHRLMLELLVSMGLNDLALNEIKQAIVVYRELRTS